MGIYDRDYYRREGHSFLGSWTDRGKVCKWLIGINIVVFILQVITRRWGGAADGLDSSAGFVTDWLVLNVDKVLHGEVWRLLTYAFLHDPTWIMHIIFNMLFLWWFGSDVEDLYGPKEFLAIYLVSAFLGGVAYVLSTVTGLTPGGVCLGASGAVMAVLVLCAMHYPTRIIMLMFLIPVPIWIFVGLAVVMDLFSFVSGVEMGTAVSVHLAGAAFAFVYYKRQWNLMDLWGRIWSWRRRSRPRLRVYPDDDSVTPVAVSAPRPPNVDEHLEAQVDALLEKVSRYGQDSLTDSEREVLFRASEAYKRKKT